MKRILLLICTAAILLTGILLPAGVVADGDHPITMTITCDPMPEIEGDGTIPSLLFTIRNESENDYLLENAKLSGGFENREMILDERITVPAGDKKEFELTDVPVTSDQLDTEIFYTLSWEETETIIDEETGDATFVTHHRESIASLLIERFVVPELSVFALCEDERVRADETFTVDYTIKNDTDFDMTGLKLCDPEQSMQSIALESNALMAGETVTVSVEYKMGTQDMGFTPRIEYMARRREMTTEAENTLTVESVTVDLKISVQPYPATAEGTDFVVTVKNAGNKTLTDIQLFDEINTAIDQPFDLAADQVKTIRCSVKPAVSSDRIRSVQFHVKAVDCFGVQFTVQDPESYQVLPFVQSDDVHLTLTATVQSPFYDENKKLCAPIQFHIRYSGGVKIRNAVLTELTLFGKVVEYDELRNGDRYFTQTYQLDGIRELRFRIDAVDPAGQTCSSETIVVDVSGLREIADRKPDHIYVQTTNPYMQDLDAKYSGVLRTVLIIGLIVAAVCAIICIVLYAVETKIRKKLPAEFEEDLERAMRSTKRRTEKQLFSDSPTERFGYTAPIKLRNYGELTEEEAKARREAYERGLRESMRREGLAPAAPPKPQPKPQHGENEGTRVLPVVKPRPAEPGPQNTTGRFEKPAPKPERPAQQTGRIERPAPKPEESDATRAVPVMKPQPAAVPVIPVVSRTAEPKHETGRIEKPVQKPERPAQQTGRIERPAPKPEESDATRAVPVVKPQPAAVPVIPVVSRTAEPIPDVPLRRPAPEPVRPAPKPAAERERPQLRPTANWQIDPMTDTVGRPAPKQPPVRTVWRDEPQPVPETEDPFVIRRRPTETAAADSLSASAPKGFRIPDPIPVKPQDGQEPCKPTVGDADPGVPHDSVNASSEPENNPPDDVTRDGQEESVPVEPDNPPDDIPQDEQRESEPLVGDADPGVPHDSVNASSEPENNPPDSLRLPPSLTQGGQEESAPAESDNPPDDIPQDEQRESEPLVGDADPGVPHDSVSASSEPENNSPDDIPQDEQRESEPLVGDADPGVPREGISASSEPENNPPDDVTRDGQEESAPAEPNNSPDDLAQDGQEESVPVEPNNSPDDLTQDGQGESEPLVGDADPGVPHNGVNASSEPENNPPDSLRLPPSLTHGGQEESTPPEPEPFLPVGPRVLQEKPKPKKRPPIGHPIVRMNG